jgi:hypothetical protein
MIHTLQVWYFGQVFGLYDGNDALANTKLSYDLFMEAIKTAHINKHRARAYILDPTVFPKRAKAEGEAALNPLAHPRDSPNGKVDFYQSAACVMYHFMKKPENAKRFPDAIVPSADDNLDENGILVTVPQELMMNRLNEDWSRAFALLEIVLTHSRYQSTSFLLSGAQKILASSRSPGFIPKPPNNNLEEAPWEARRGLVLPWQPNLTHAMLESSGTDEEAADEQTAQAIQAYTDAVPLQNIFREYRAYKDDYVKEVVEDSENEGPYKTSVQTAMEKLEEQRKTRNHAEGLSLGILSGARKNAVKKEHVDVEAQRKFGRWAENVVLKNVRWDPPLYGNTTQYEVLGVKNNAAAAQLGRDLLSGGAVREEMASDPAQKVPSHEGAAQMLGAEYDKSRKAVSSFSRMLSLLQKSILMAESGTQHWKSVEEAARSHGLEKAFEEYREAVRKDPKNYWLGIDIAPHDDAKRRHPLPSQLIGESIPLQCSPLTDLLSRVLMRAP